MPHCSGLIISAEAWVQYPYASDMAEKERKLRSSLVVQQVKDLASLQSLGLLLWHQWIPGLGNSICHRRG